MTAIRVLLWFALCPLIASCAAADITPLFTFNGEPGSVTAAQMSRGSLGALKYVTGHRGRGLYLPPGAAVSLPVKGLNPAEGTLSFWFRRGRAMAIDDVNAAISSTNVTFISILFLQPRPKCNPIAHQPESPLLAVAYF